MIHDRFDEAFREWRCADCDPDAGGEEYEKPYVLLLPHGESAPTHCPRCESYLSFCEGDDGLRITNHWRDRLMARKAEA